MMNDMDAHFSRVADSYNGIRTTDLEPILHIKERLNGHRIIKAADIGCGAGRYCLELFQHLNNLHLTCIDSNEPMLQQTTKYLSDAGITNFTPLLSSAEDTTLPDNSMDYTFSFNAVHHFNFAKFMAEAARITKGRIFIYTRLRDQNARNIWGRYFPLFKEKESRLYDLDDMQGVIESMPSVTVEAIEEFHYMRAAPLSKLVELAKNRHYSTFSLYGEQEFESALAEFQENVKHFNPDSLAWFDENVLLVIRK